MSLFDFLFPEQAQAAHLRRLVTTTSLANARAQISSAIDHNTQVSMQKRIGQLENEVGQLTIIIEALMESIAEKGVLTKEDIARKIGEIDARDGTIDGRITKPAPPVSQPPPLRP